MGKRKNLLSSTLVLSQSADECNVGDHSSKCKLTFGEPFKFGKTLTFGHQAYSSDTVAAYHNANKPHSGSLASSVPLLQQPYSSSAGSKNQQQLHNNSLHNVGFSAAASQYYLGSLGAALAHGCATQAAAAAAVASTACTASELAAASMLQAAWVSQAAAAAKATTTAAAAKAAGAAAAASKVMVAEQAAPAGSAVASAAAAAAAAACFGCPGCRMVLERLQRCSQCCARRPDGSKLLDESASGKCVSTSGSGSSRPKRKLTAAGTQEDSSSCKDDMPGPGCYTLPSSFGQGVAFSMGAKPAAAVDRAGAELPGPGYYYNPRLGLSSAGGPAFSIGGRWKDAAQEAAAPGPGEHQQMTCTAGGPAFSMSGKPSASRSVRSSSPGPGAYAPDWDRSTSPSGPAYSMASRLLQPEAAQRAASPGPAEYQQTEFKPDGPAYSFPAKRSSRRPSSTAADVSSTPAPTDYDVGSIHAIGKSGPAYSMGSPTKRPYTAADPAAKDLMPGPGWYYVGDSGPSGPAFSMGARPAEVDGSKKAAGSEPAPGDYYRDLPSSAPAFSMSGRPNSPTAGPTAEQDSLRGPGLYFNPAAEAALQGSKAFTIGARFAAADAATGRDSPGPATYEVQVDESGPSYSIGARIRTTDKGQDIPGPAAYTVKPSIPSGPCFTMGTRPSERGAAADADGPAVGDYDVIDTSGMAVNGPAWTLTGRRADQKQQYGADSPGPGQYLMDAPAGPSGPAWTIASRYTQPEDADTAGPGPGEYSSAACQGPSGPAFTMAGRGEAGGSTRTADTPGPGAYLSSDYADPSAADAPAFTIGGKPASFVPQSTVGPGAFDLPELPKGPSFTIPSAVRAGATEAASSSSSPGPAAYEVAVAAAAVAGAAPAWTMGTRLKDNIAGDAASSPAPGDYTPEDPAAAAAPAWTIAGKPAASSAEEQGLQPGPGWYMPVDPVKEGQGPAFSIAGKFKDAAAADRDEIPAPGAYELPAGPSGAAYTMAGKAAPAAGAAGAASLPAPGQYYKPSQPGTNAPAYTIAARLAHGSCSDTAGKEQQPGPGDYELRTELVAASAPAYTMAGRPAAVAVDGADLPGVGQYDVQAVGVGPAAPAYTMGVRLAVQDKVADGPSCVDYHTEGLVTSTTLSAPAFTMAGRLQQSQDPTTDLPAPGQYHSAATAGPPPNAPAAPAFTIQGKHKKGKTRLKQMLGRLAALDEALPGPGEHQPVADGSTAASGPAYSFGPAAAPISAGNTAAAAAGAGSGGDVPPQAQSLAQLQAQLARLLTKQVQTATRKAKASAAASAATSAKVRQSTPVATTALQRTGNSSSSNSVAQASEGGSAVIDNSNSGSRAASSKSLAAISDAVNDALQAGSSSRRKKHSSSRSSKDFAAPAPGDHFSASNSSSIGKSGPAYTMAGKLHDSSCSNNVRGAADRVASADGFAAVFAAAAAADRAAGVPGAGTYHVDRPFPHPEGTVVYKPILKKHSRGGAAASNAGPVMLTAGQGQGAGGCGSGHLNQTIRSSNSTRRVSWADAC